MDRWSEWRPFPDPRTGGYLVAPFGPGVYELMNQRVPDKKVLYGMGKNVACRMSSLLPAPHGCGNRNNQEKRDYVLANIQDILYRTMACPTRKQAADVEAALRQGAGGYIFPE